MRLKHVFLALLAIASLAACKKEDKPQVKAPVLTVSADTVKLSCEAASPVFTVNSNRAWSIQMPEACDWITPDPLSGGSKSDKETSVEVKLEVAALEGLASRTYTLYVISDDTALDMVPVIVMQDGAPASLSVSSDNPVNDISPEGADVLISVVSNTAWSAAVKEAATATVTLDKTSGSGNGSIKAVVAANSSLNPLTATIVISAAECAGVEVVLNQKKADIIPELKVEIPARTVYTDPALFSSLGGTRWFAVKSNVPWTAKVGSGTTAADVSIATMSGEGNLDKFEVTAGPNRDLDGRKVVEIEFNSDGMEPVKVTLGQEKGSILALEFRDQTNSNSAWPFDQDPGKQGEVGPGKYTVGGYEIPYRATVESFQELDANKGSWRIGKGVGIWVESPVIEGRKLSRVSVADYNTGHFPSINTADDAMTVVMRGAYADLDREQVRDSIVTWTLAGTKVSTPYRLVSNEDKTMRIKYLVFEYAEASAPEPSYLTAELASAEDISYAGGSGSISVSSNTSWTAAVKDGATAQVNLVNSSGTGDGTVTFTVAANDEETAKEAVIVISAAGCKDVELTVTQVKAPAQASIDASLATKGDSWYVEPGVLSSLGSNSEKANADHGRRPIYITAKKAWTAKVGDETTAAGVRLSQDSGEAGESVLYVSVGQNTDFNTEKKVVVELKAEGEDPVQVELTQKAAKVVTFEFRTFDRSAVCWPFEETAKTDGEGTYTAGEYTVGYYTTATTGMEANYGWMIGRGTDFYVVTPKVTGHKLVRITMADNNATNPKVITADGDEVSGGAAVSNTAGKLFTWNLSGTEDGVSYRIKPTANKSMRILHLEFEYE